MPGEPPAIQHAELAYALGDGQPVTWLSLRVERGPVAGGGALAADRDLDLALEHDEHLLGAVGVGSEVRAGRELEVHRGGAARTGAAVDGPRGADDVVLVVAVVRGERDIAVGNVIGSNIFNILGVLGIAGLAAPGGLTAAPGVLGFGMLVMLAAAIACIPVAFTRRMIARWEGGLFLFFFAAYTTYLFLYAQHHPWLASFSVAMLGFVLPLTAVTLAVTTWREWRQRRR